MGQKPPKADQNEVAMAELTVERVSPLNLAVVGEVAWSRVGQT